MSRILTYQSLGEDFSVLGVLPAQGQTAPQGQTAHDELNAQQRAEKKLHESEARSKQMAAQFKTLLEHIDVGVSMFDAEQRLIIANTLFAETYGFTPEQLLSGMTFRKVLEHRISNGQFAGENQEDYIRERLDAVRSPVSASRIHKLSNGRYIRIKYKPLEHGGWVSTHEDVTEEQRSAATIAHMAHHDALTDLPNRILIQQRLTEALARVTRGSRMALHFIDLDHFKNVNDMLGHGVGDKLLQSVAQRLKDTVREVDMVARLGGDEFAIIQETFGSLSDVGVLAERVIAGISEPYEIDGHHIIVGASVGIALAPRDGDTAETLLKNSDLALYQAKESGRGVYNFF